MSKLIRFVYGNDVSSDVGYTILEDSHELTPGEKKEIIDICSKFGNFASLSVPSVGEAISYMYLPMSGGRYLLVKVIYLGEDNKGRKGAVKFECLVVSEDYLISNDYDIFLTMYNLGLLSDDPGIFDFKYISSKVVMRGLSFDKDPLFFPYAVSLSELLNGKKIIFRRDNYRELSISLEILWKLMPIELRKRIKLCTYSFSKSSFWDILGLDYTQSTLEALDDLIANRSYVNFHPYVKSVYEVLSAIKQGDINREADLEKLIKYGYVKVREEVAKPPHAVPGGRESQPLIYVVLFMIMVIFLGAYLLFLRHEPAPYSDAPGAPDRAVTKPVGPTTKPSETASEPAELASGSYSIGASSGDLEVDNLKKAVSRLRMKLEDIRGMLSKGYVPPGDLRIDELVSYVQEFEKFAIRAGIKQVKSSWESGVESYLDVIKILEKMGEDLTDLKLRWVEDKLKVDEEIRKIKALVQDLRVTAGRMVVLDGFIALRKVLRERSFSAGESDLRDYADLILRALDGVDGEFGDLRSKLSLYRDRGGGGVSFPYGDVLAAFDRLMVRFPEGEALFSELKKDLSELERRGNRWILYIILVLVVLGSSGLGCFSLWLRRRRVKAEKSPFLDKFRD